MKNYLVIAIFLVILGVGGLFIVKNQSSKDTVSNNMPAVQTETKDVKEKEVIKEFSVTAKSWAFDPAIITVKQGDKVKLTIKSVDVTHGFALPDFNVKVDLTPNKEEVVEFIADKKGEYTFFCSVMCGAGHRDMTGKLVVE